MTTYETVIGLEFHAELKTKTKIFCSCPTTFAGEQNTHVCPVCLGLPGVLPVLNRQAVELAVRAGLALNCAISMYSKFDRKNYFYPDLPKGYQVTQFPMPICKDGWIMIKDKDGKDKKVRINRIHMEEDAGKLVHSGENLTVSNYSLPDYNRAAVPLIEIVTEPDISSDDEAKQFAENLKLRLEYAGVSDVKMEQGSLRCDVNISLRPQGQEEFGVRTEIKNLNSFRSILRAIQYEEIRQADILDDGGAITQETMTWDDNNGCTLSMRSKEDAHDYRYFPEPDLVPIVLTAHYIQSVADAMPEMPLQRKTRLIEQLGLSEYDAAQLVGYPLMALFYDRVLEQFDDAKQVANWLLGDVSKLINTMDNGADLEEMPVTVENFVELMNCLKDKTINNNTAKEVLEMMFQTGEAPGIIIERAGFGQISDTAALEAAVQEVIAKNPNPVNDYKQGKKQAIGFLLGQIMKATGGQANPQVVRAILTKALDA